VRSCEELLDRLEEELEGATPTESFLAPSHLGPVPPEHLPRARRVQARMAEAELELAHALAVLRQELALLPGAPAEPSRFVDTLA
jgi:hypothetical protein